jgi:hypothetical protein
MLSDFDWIDETFAFRPAQRDRVQQFPILVEVGNTILRYLQHSRPILGMLKAIRPPVTDEYLKTHWTLVLFPYTSPRTTFPTYHKQGEARSENRREY